MFEECFGNGPFIFRLNENGSGPQLLTQVRLEHVGISLTFDIELTFVKLVN